MKSERLLFYVGEFKKQAIKYKESLLSVRESLLLPSFENLYGELIEFELIGYIRSIKDYSLNKLFIKMEKLKSRIKVYTNILLSISEKINKQIIYKINDPCEGEQSKFPCLYNFFDLIILKSDEHDLIISKTMILYQNTINNLNIIKLSKLQNENKNLILSDKIIKVRDQKIDSMSRIQDYYDNLLETENNVRLKYSSLKLLAKDLSSIDNANSALK